MSAFAIMRVDKGAVEVRLAGIVHSEERRVFGVEFRPEIKAPLLHPALEVALRNFVWMREQRIIRFHEFHGRILLRHSPNCPNSRPPPLSSRLNRPPHHSP